MRRIYILPNAVTAFGLACGLFVIFHSSMTGIDTYEMLRQSLLILILAAIADVLDGAVARAIHAESEFGLMFDSIADVVSFGVAPSVLFLRSLDVGFSGPYALLALGGAMLYTVCGALRLVRFSVKSSSAKGDKEAELNMKQSFEGLPIPAAAMAAVSPALFLSTPLFESLVSISHTLRAVILSCVMMALAYLMISKWRFASIKTFRIKVASFHLIFLTVMAAIILIYGILHYLSILVLVSFWGYIIVGLILSIIRKISGRKSQKLLDFEPDDEEEK
ncbi:MAG: phosphatidylcholine/phosphatidylserine synthase [Chlamydiae bacterium]|nr:phosphatidylcholine/phosphatidylserine synthase [Chlamydiota bacterium]